ncbi:alpha-1,4-N-acetylglucosaminyltransferase-like [Hyperolius riggenbachi]|uniref:alpha-1,4-N-acetylglucosaminyltransferase-like n=1 Tax=Hyperolius riggenbachi TaxID=752182 RepID=UPI0035A36AD9
MIKGLKIISFLLIVSAVGFLYNVVYKSSHNTYFSNFFIENIRHVLFNINLTSAHKSITPSAGTTTTETPEDILRRGDSIIFLETSDRMHLPSLVLCALESAARVYPDRHVFFFMKGINHTASQDNEEVILRHYPTLSSLNNIHIVPLIMEDIFNSTPLFPWYKKINATKEPHWIHVSADGCRLALIWKYGGIYMDTDIISIYPIPHYDFLAGESNKYSSNGVYGFPAQHNFTWTCMEDFVQNYNGCVTGTG